MSIVEEKIARELWWWFGVKLFDDLYESCVSQFLWNFVDAATNFVCIGIVANKEQSLASAQCDISCDICFLEDIVGAIIV